MGTVSPMLMTASLLSSVVISGVATTFDRVSASMICSTAWNCVKSGLPNAESVGLLNGNGELSGKNGSVDDVVVAVELENVIESPWVWFGAKKSPLLTLRSNGKIQGRLEPFAEIEVVQSMPSASCSPMA